MMAFFVHVSWNVSSAWWDFSLGVAFWSLFVLVIDGRIYWLNQYAIRKQLEPRRQDLLKFVSSLESEPNAEDAGDVVDLVSAFVDPARNGSYSWEGWAANWNQIVPSWRVATAIIIPTLVGALCGLYSGLRFRIPEMGPVFFQTIVGAVIPFEVVLFTFVYLAARKKKQMQSILEISDQKAPATGVVLVQCGDQEPKRLPRAPALVILILTLFVGIMAILALISFSMSYDTKAARVSHIRFTTSCSQIFFEYIV